MNKKTIELLLDAETNPFDTSGMGGDSDAMNDIIKMIFINEYEKAFNCSVSDDETSIFIDVDEDADYDDVYDGIFNADYDNEILRIFSQALDLTDQINITFEEIEEIIRKGGDAIPKKLADDKTFCADIEIACKQLDRLVDSFGDCPDGFDYEQELKIECFIGRLSFNVYRDYVKEILKI